MNKRIPLTVQRKQPRMVTDVVVDDKSVVSNDIAKIDFKTINNKSILGKGNIDVAGGGGGSGDYNELINKPTINGELLEENLTSEDLGLAPASHTHAISNVSGLQAALNNKSDVGHTHSQYATESELADKQDKLVSGTNVKTINNQSILGTGNITIEGGSGGDVPDATATTKGIVLLGAPGGAAAYSHTHDYVTENGQRATLIAVTLTGTNSGSYTFRRADGSNVSFATVSNMITQAPKLLYFRGLVSDTILCATAAILNSSGNIVISSVRGSVRYTYTFTSTGAFTKNEYTLGTYSKPSDGIPYSDLTADLKEKIDFGASAAPADHTHSEFSQFKKSTTYVVDENTSADIRNEIITKVANGEEVNVVYQGVVCRLYYNQAEPWFMGMDDDLVIYYVMVYSDRIAFNAHITLANSSILANYQEKITSSSKLDYSLLKNTPTVVSSVKVNGTSYSPSNGVVDLGNIAKSDVTEATVEGWGFTKDAYTKPVGGIPLQDMSAAVQTALVHGSSALQGDEIKTINNKSLLGSGNLTLSTLGIAAASHTHDFGDVGATFSAIPVGQGGLSDGAGRATIGKLRIQWGSDSVSVPAGAQATKDISFSAAYANIPYVGVNLFVTATGSTNIRHIALGAVTKSNFTARLWNAGTSTATLYFRWVSIGFLP